MAIRFQCPHCQVLLSISSRRIGAVVPCPTCSRDVLVPERDMFDPAPAFAQLITGPRRAEPPPPPSPVLDEPLRLVGDARGAQFETRDELPPLDGPSLELQFDDGRHHALPLNKSAPVTIGKQAFNDIAVSEGDVAALHCRIGWNKTVFEVTAATAKGVDVNGTIVEHAVLRPGDILRIGSLDVIFHDVEPPAEPEMPVAAASPAPSKPMPPPEPSLFEGPVIAESASDLPVAEAEESEELAAVGHPPPKPEAVPQGLVGRVWHELDGARRRPGEQDPFRSPWILGITAATLAVALAAAAIWFLIGREQRLRLFEQADTELMDGKYAEAVQHFEEFLAKYPTHRMSRAAALGAGKARVLKEIAGGAQAWDIAWQHLDELVQTNRNTADYRDLQPLVREYAEQIAIGAARAAEATKKASLLEISEQATGLMERSADPDSPQSGPLEIIRTATIRAKLAIARQHQLDAAVTNMQSALANGQPITALSERAALLRALPEFGKESRIRDTLQRALKVEQGLIAAEDIDRPALTKDHPEVHSVVPAFHTRSRSDETSLGQSVFVVAQDAVYAVDTITGEPVWRRVVGSDLPFFPVTVRGSVPGVLLFDARRRELALCRTDTGEAIWRQPLEQPPVAAPPCLEEGQLYLATQGGRLERFDLETGRHTARLRFSQDLAGSPVVSPGKTHLFVVGDRGLIYTLRRNPLECAALTFTDHAPKTVRAPLLVLGRMLLLCENDQGTSARLRIWDASNPDATLPEVPGEPQRVAGSVYESPVLRGSHLVVPSSGERLAAFAVNDEPGRMGLAPIGQYRLESRYDGPQYVMLGPDQQFWASSTAFRRFEIAAESLRMDSKTAAVGLTAQPLHAVGETFFVARRPFFGEAVIFTNIDREQMTGTWRLGVGGRPRELLAGATGGATLVTDSALLFRLGANRLNQGGLEFRSGTELEAPADLAQPLLIGRLSDGRVALAVPGPGPKLWFIDGEGRVSAGPAFDRSPQCPPILLDDGLVWPSAGRLQLKPLTGSKRFDDWRAPSDEDDEPAWAWLVHTGAHEFLGCQQDGTLRRFQARTGDVPHIAEVSSVRPPLALDVLPVLLGDELATVSAEHAVQWINVRSLDLTLGPKLSANVRAIQPAAKDLLAQLTDGTVVLIASGSDSVAWQAELGAFTLAGTPHVTESSLWVADVHGTLAELDRQTGRVLRKKQVPQALGLGVREIAGTLWAVAVDGALYRLQDLPEVQP